MKYSIVFVIMIACHVGLRAQSADSAKTGIRLNPASNQYSTGVLSPELAVVVIKGHNYRIGLHDLPLIDLNWVENVNVYQGQNAIERYGKSGEKGVIQYEIRADAPVSSAFSNSLKDL